MDGRSRALHNNVCSCCGLLSSSAKDGLCSACYELLLTPTVTMVDAANQTDLMANNPEELSNSNNQELTEAAAVITENDKLNENIAKNIESNISASNIDTMLPTVEEEEVNNSSSNTPTTKFNKASKIIIKKKQKNRCLVCQKKIGLYAVQCRCGGIFCAYHRYSDRHDCKFDYRAMGAEEILRNNPRVVGTKINKI